MEKHTQHQAYAGELLGRIKSKIKKGNETKDLLNKYIENKIDHKKIEINFETLSVPFTSETLQITIHTFPNARIVTIPYKPDTNPETFMFPRLQQLKNLKELKLFIHNGATGKINHTLRVERLKLYNKSLVPKESILNAILNKIRNLKSLTISEGHLSTNNMPLIHLSDIECLSLKNVHIIKNDERPIWRLLNRTSLYKLKLIQTKPATRYSNMFKLITDYLNKLPHKHLQVFHFSLPSKIEPIEYKKILQYLDLLQLKIYISTRQNFNDINQILPLLEYNNEQQFKTPIELVFYTPFSAHQNDEINMDETRQILSKFKEVEVNHKFWPYLAFPMSKERMHKITSIAAYRRETFNAKHLKTPNEIQNSGSMQENCVNDTILPENELEIEYVCTETLSVTSESRKNNTPESRTNSQNALYTESESENSMDTGFTDEIEISQTKIEHLMTETSENDSGPSKKDTSSSSNDDLLKFIDSIDTEELNRVNNEHFEESDLNEMVNTYFDEFLKNENDKGPFLSSNPTITQTFETQQTNETMTLTNNIVSNTQEPCPNVSSCTINQCTSHERTPRNDTYINYENIFNETNLQRVNNLKELMDIVTDIFITNDQ